MRVHPRRPFLHPVRALAGWAQASGRGRISRGLIVLQFALSTALVIVSLAMARQLDYTTSMGLGRDGDRVAMAYGVGFLTGADLGRLQDEIEARPGLVQGIAGTNPPPGFGGMDPGPLTFGVDTLVAKPFLVSPQYLRVMGTRVPWAASPAPATAS